VGPLSLIAYRASAYVREVFHTLEDPGIPVELKYRSQTGDVITLRAEHYVVSLKDKFVRIDHPQVLDTRGTIVADLRYLEARNVNYRNLGDQVIHVRGSGLNVRVTRLSSGQLDLTNFLPEKKGPPSTIPFDVTLTHINATFVDEMGPRKWSQTVTTPEVRVTGLGDDWIASTTVSLKGIGTFPVDVEKVTGFGIQAKTTTRGAELAPVWEHLSQTPPFVGTDYADARADSIRINGPIRVFIPEGSDSKGPPPVAETRLNVTAQGVRWKQYAADNANFTGLVTGAGASGKLDATLGANRLYFGGSAVWTKGLQASGETRVESPQPDALPAWLKKQIPANVNYQNALFSGWVSYRSSTDYRASGQVRATSLSVQNEQVQNLTTSVSYSPGKLTANVRQATYTGKPVSGAFTLNTNDRSLSGVVQSKNFDLSIIADRFKVKGLSGKGEVLAALGGTVAKPTIDISSQGTAAFVQGSRKLSGRYDISGSYANNAVKVSRALLRGDFGLISASGAIGEKGDLGIKVIGRDLNPSLIDSRVSGQANLTAKVTGTASKPEVKGYIEAYNIAAKNYLIPAISAHFSADMKRVDATDVRATHGTAELIGDGSYTFASQAISGKVGIRGLELADIVGQGFAGLIDISDAVIGGTIKRPTLTASLTGRNVVAQELKVDAVSAQLSSDGHIAKLESASAEVARGTVSATAQYDLDKETGSAQVNAKIISLADVTPKISTAIATRGRVGGNAQINFTSKGISSIDAGGRLGNVHINGTDMGNGLWNLAFDGQKYSGKLEVGVIERYVSVEKVIYDPDTKVVSGELNVLNSDVQDLVAIGSRYLTDASPSLITALRTARGQVTVGGVVSGLIDKPKIDLNSFEASELSYEGVPLGKLVAKASIEGTQIKLKEFGLDGGAITAKVTGNADTAGEVDMSVDLSVPLLASLGPIVPQLANDGGTSQISFVATGPIKKPDLHFSISASKLMTAIPPKEDLEETEEQRTKRLKLEAEALRFSLTGEVSGGDSTASLGGDYFYRGFQGHLEANTPFDYQHGIPADGKTTGFVTVAERSLSDIAQFLPNIDGKLTKGSVSGRFDAAGSPNNLVLSGGIRLQAETLSLVVPKFTAPDASGPAPAPNTIDDKFKNVDVSLKLSGDKLALHASGESSRGGAIDANVSTPIGEIQRLFTTVKEAGLSSLMDNPLTGSVKMDKFAIRQTFPTPSNPAEALGGLLGGFLGATADGEITIAGTVGEPDINGKVALTKVDSEIPTIVGGSGQPTTALINPTFDLRVTLGEPARIRTTAATLSVLGGGRLTGTLESPSVKSSLQVEDGSITLPAATVRVEQGGTVSFNYEPAPDGAIARLDVDMEGRTAITALKYGETYERYEITLGVKGDLLKDGGLQLTAQSDPPDLTQDRILAMLGQVDLISSVATGGFGQSDTEKRLRDALTGFALPALTSALTNKLARGIGFEYLTIEYNGYEQASVAFGKALGAGFSIQGRRQVGEPLPGFKALYDIRLVYRPRRVRGVLSRFSFSLGADQDRPFKAAIEYGFRF